MFRVVLFVGRYTMFVICILLGLKPARKTYNKIVLYNSVYSRNVVVILCQLIIDQFVNHSTNYYVSCDCIADCMDN